MICLIEKLLELLSPLYEYPKVLGKMSVMTRSVRRTARQMAAMTVLVFGLVFKYWRKRKGWTKYAEMSDKTPKMRSVCRETCPPKFINLPV